MRLNVLKLATVALAVGSLLVPWVSSALFLSDGENFIYDLSFDYSPICYHVAFTDFRNSTLENGEHMYYYPPLVFPADIMFLAAVGRVPQGYDLASILAGIYGFSVCFVVVGLLATSIWQSSTEKVFVTSFCLLSLGTFFTLLSKIVRYKMSFDSWIIASQATATSFGTEEIFFTNSILPGVGFFLAILSVLFLVASYQSPKYVDLPIKLDVEIVHRLRKPWPAVPERERLLTIFLITFFVAWVHFLIALFPHWV